MSVVKDYFSIANIRELFDSSKFFDIFILFPPKSDSLQPLTLVFYLQIYYRYIRQIY